MIGRQEAHDVVYASCRIVAEQGGTFAEVLANNPEVCKHFDRAALAHLTDPANYVGAAPAMVDEVLAHSAAGTPKEAS
jgi:3-carboxy-cis,cis-muconate cycloisomerase